MSEMSEDEDSDEEGIEENKISDEESDSGSLSDTK